MIFAHIPAGYLLANAIVKRKRWSPLLLWVGMLGGTFPDIDILYAQFSRHAFLEHRVLFTHFPFFWLLLASAVFTGLLLANRKDLFPAWTIFFSAVFLHLVLDTVVGTVFWLAPFSYVPIAMFPPITERYVWWLLDSVFSWRFLIELAMIFAAGVVFFRGGWRDLFRK